MLIIISYDNIIIIIILLRIIICTNFMLQYKINDGFPVTFCLLICLHYIYLYSCFSPLEFLIIKTLHHSFLLNTIVLSFLNARNYIQYNYL